MSAIKFFTGLIVGALILFGAGFWTLQQRRGEERVLAQQSDASAVPAVSVVHPTVTPPNGERCLRWSGTGAGRDARPVSTGSVTTSVGCGFCRTPDTGSRTGRAASSR